MQSIGSGCYKTKSVTKFLYLQNQSQSLGERKKMFLFGLSGDLEHGYDLPSTHFCDPQISRFKSKQIRHIKKKYPPLIDQSKAMTFHLVTYSELQKSFDLAQPILSRAKLPDNSNPIWFCSQKLFIKKKSSASSIRRAQCEAYQGTMWHLCP